MRHSLTTDLMRHLSRAGGFPIDHAPRPLEQRLEQLSLPKDVKRLLQWQWPRVPVVFGPYDIAPVEAVLAHDDLSRLLAAQMVPVGGARNGDILVIRSSGPDQAEVGLVSHDELWEKQALDPLAAYTPVATTVEAFLYAVAQGHFLPRDSYSARELQSLLRANAAGGA